MQIKEIKELIEAVCASDIREFKYSNNGVKIAINRNAATYEMPVITTQQTTVPQPQIQMPIPVPTQAETKSALEVTSPIVGVFYTQGSPESPAFAKVGEIVKKGSPLCIIEAMKLMNEVTAEYDMKILQVLVANEDVVEFGQPLFKVERAE